METADRFLERAMRFYTMDQVDLSERLKVVTTLRSTDLSERTRIIDLSGDKPRQIVDLGADPETQVSL